MLLLYGKEDPWVRPLWGQRLKRRLPEAMYLELSPAGYVAVWVNVRGGCGAAS